jgi:hypothetical protein
MGNKGMRGPINHFLHGAQADGHMQRIFPPNPKR